jgi:hypothetical protein
MKKYSILTALALTAVSFASAETQVTQQVGIQKQPQENRQIMPPVITTGDATVDARIKALQEEMEVKIKAIREEYQVKIKTAIGDKKILNQLRNGTSTQRIGREGEGREGRATSSPITKDDAKRRFANEVSTSSGRELLKKASTTPMTPGKQMPKDGRQITTDRQVRGASTTAESVQQENEGGVGGFFGRLFGR